jgi:hypothetical protein
MKLSQILFHPFVRIAGGTALLLGLVAITLAGLIGAGQGLHFDGVLDTHAGKVALGGSSCPRASSTGSASRCCC